MAVAGMIPLASSSVDAPLLASLIISLRVRVPAFILTVKLYRSKLPMRKPPTKAKMVFLSSTLSQAFLVSSHQVRYSLDVSSFL